MLVQPLHSHPEAITQQSLSVTATITVSQCRMVFQSFDSHTTWSCNHSCMYSNFLESPTFLGSASELLLPPSQQSTQYHLFRPSLGLWRSKSMVNVFVCTAVGSGLHTTQLPPQQTSAVDETGLVFHQRV